MGRGGADAEKAPTAALPGARGDDMALARRATEAARIGMGMVRVGIAHETAKYVTRFKNARFERKIYDMLIPCLRAHELRTQHAA